MMLELPAQTTEYVRVSVDTDDDPTTGTVEFAFVRPGVDPVTNDWTAGSWESGEADPYEAKFLLGPSGDKTLNEGQWAVWVRILASPESIVRNVGTVRLT